MKTYDSLVQATIRLMGAEEENRHVLLGNHGFADDVVQIFFKEYHMREFPKDCLQELKMEFVNADGDKKVVVLSVTSTGNLTLGIDDFSS